MICTALSSSLTGNYMNTLNNARFSGSSLLFKTKKRMVSMRQQWDSLYMSKDFQDLGFVTYINAHNTPDHFI